MSTHGFHSWDPPHCHRSPLCFKIFTNYLGISAVDVEMPWQKFLRLWCQANFIVCFESNLVRCGWIFEWLLFNHTWARIVLFFIIPPRSAWFAHIEMNFINKSDTWTERTELYRTVRQITLSARFPISWTSCLLYSSVAKLPSSRECVFIISTHIEVFHEVVEWQMLARYSRKFLFGNFFDYRSQNTIESAFLTVHSSNWTISSRMPSHDFPRSEAVNLARSPLNVNQKNSINVNQKIIWFEFFFHVKHTDRAAGTPRRASNHSHLSWSEIQVRHSRVFGYTSKNAFVGGSRLEIWFKYWLTWKRFGDRIFTFQV